MSTLLFPNISINYMEVAPLPLEGGVVIFNLIALRLEHPVKFELLILVKESPKSTIFKLVQFLNGASLDGVYP